MLRRNIIVLSTIQKINDDIWEQSVRLKEDYYKKLLI